MTQLAVVRTKEAAVLGVDSMAIQYSDEGEISYVQNITKLLRLAPDTVVAIAGSGYGVQLAEQLRHHVRKVGLWRYEDVVRRSVVFLRERLRFLRTKLAFESKHPDLERFYFVFCGIDRFAGEKKLPKPEIHVVISEELNQPATLLEIESVLTIPRQVSLEYRLMQASMQNRKAKELIRMMLVYFRNLADAVDDVGPPYQFVVVGRDEVSFDCADS
ncbi:MAG: hypothetical protein JRI45_05610 [Deltaproteobacteria bacterium]|nr:hypothetical protein [Deltaproteobacteria bacterium]MBW2067740.1 hypothetical protein [Deltaproteobacteria bacterium]